MKTISARLRHYVDGNPRLRRFGDWSSMMAALLWYVFAVAWLGISDEASTAQAIAVLCIVNLGITAVYCWKPELYSSFESAQVAIARSYSSGSDEQNNDMSLPRRWSIAALGLLAALIASGRRLEATALTARIERIATDEHPDPRAALDVLDSAIQRGIVLPPVPIQKIAKARVSTTEALDAVSENVTRNARQRGIYRKPWGMMIRKKTEVGKVIIDEIAQSMEHLYGPPDPEMTAVPADLMAFVASIGREPSLDPNGRPGVGMIRIIGEDRIQIRLDGKHIKNVVFDNCELLYNGEPIKIENSGFVSCTFKFTRGLKSQQLAQALLRSPSVTLDI